MNVFHQIALGDPKFPCNPIGGHHTVYGFEDIVQFGFFDNAMASVCDPTPRRFFPVVVESVDAYFTGQPNQIKLVVNY